MSALTPMAWLHFGTLAVSLFGVGVAIATAWGVHFRKRDVRWSPVDLPEGGYFLMFLCTGIALLTYKHAGPVINGHLQGGVQTAAVVAYVSAIFFAGLHFLLGAHIFIGTAFLYGDRHHNRGH